MTVTIPALTSYSHSVPPLVLTNHAILCTIVTIPLVPSRQMDKESALALWKKNIASWRTTERCRGAHPAEIRAGKRELVDTKERMRRITARIDTEAEDADEQLSIARLVSAEGD